LKPIRESPSESIVYSRLLLGQHISTILNKKLIRRSDSERKLYDDVFNHTHHSRSTPILRSLHWLKITERIECKLLSLTYKVLTTTQPPYLHHLISVQPPHRTCSSSVVTLARPPTSSSLRITDLSFRYASPCLWNQLPSSLRQPRLSSSVSVLPVHAPTTSPHSVNSPLSPSITPFLSLPPQDLPLSQILPTTDSLPASGLTPRTSRPDRFFRASPFLVLVSSLFFFVRFRAAD